MTVNITDIIIALATFIFGVLVKYLIPMLNEKVDEKKRAKIADIIDTGVAAADRWLKTASGEEKKQYVVNYLAEKGYMVDLKDIHSELNVMIEAAVDRLRFKQSVISK
jgi:hypothetical protein